MRTASVAAAVRPLLTAACLPHAPRGRRGYSSGAHDARRPRASGGIERAQMAPPSPPPMAGVASTPLPQATGNNRRDPASKYMHADNVAGVLRRRKRDATQKIRVDPSTLTPDNARWIVGACGGQEREAREVLKAVAQWAAGRHRGMPMPALLEIVKAFARLDDVREAAVLAKLLARSMTARGYLNYAVSAHSGPRAGHAFDDLVLCVDLIVEILLKCAEATLGHPRTGPGAPHASASAGGALRPGPPRGDRPPEASPAPREGNSDVPLRPQHVVLAVSLWLLHQDRVDKLHAPGLARLMDAHVRVGHVLLFGRRDTWRAEEYAQLDALRARVLRRAARLSSPASSPPWAFCPATSHRFVCALPAAWVREGVDGAALVREMVAAFAPRWRMRVVAAVTAHLRGCVAPAAPYPLHHQLFAPLLAELARRCKEIPHGALSFCVHQLLASRAPPPHPAYAALLDRCGTDADALAVFLAYLRHTSEPLPSSFAAALGGLLTRRIAALDLWGCRFAVEHRAHLRLAPEAVDEAARRWFRQVAHSNLKITGRRRAAYVTDFAAQFAAPAAHPPPVWLVLQLAPPTAFADYTALELRLLGSVVFQGMSRHAADAGTAPGAATWLDALRQHLTGRNAATDPARPDIRLYANTERLTGRATSAAPTPARHARGGGGK